MREREWKSGEGVGSTGESGGEGGGEREEGLSVVVEVRGLVIECQRLTPDCQVQTWASTIHNFFHGGCGELWRGWGDSRWTRGREQVMDGTGKGERDGSGRGMG